MLKKEAEVVDIKGKHLLIDAFECDEVILNDPSLLRRILIEAALDAEMEVLHCYFHQFTPQGITGILVLATSHLSIHTWPEENYASLDFYTCGDKEIIEIGYALLKQLASKKLLCIRFLAEFNTPKLQQKIVSMLKALVFSIVEMTQITLV